MTNQVDVVRIAPLVTLPTRRSWGEAWWTARDVCITNEPEFADPFEAIHREHDRRLFEAFIFGDIRGTQCAQP